MTVPSNPSLMRVDNPIPTPRAGSLAAVPSRVVLLFVLAVGTTGLLSGCGGGGSTTAMLDAPLTSETPEQASASDAAQKAELLRRGRARNPETAGSDAAQRTLERRPGR